MPYIDAALFNKKGVKRMLTLILDEGDGILESVKQAMVEHKVHEVTVESVEGRLKEAVINYFERNQFKSSALKGSEIMIASGNFKLSYGDLFGTMKIATNEKPPMHGTLVRGKASQGLTINLSFIEFIDKEEKPKTVK